MLIFDCDPLLRVISISEKDPGKNLLMNYQNNYDNIDIIDGKDAGGGGARTYFHYADDWLIGYKYTVVERSERIGMEV